MQHGGPYWMKIRWKKFSIESTYAHEHLSNHYSMVSLFKKQFKVDDALLR